MYDLGDERDKPASSQFVMFEDKFTAHDLSIVGKPVLS